MLLNDAVLKVIEDHPDCNSDYALSISVKSLNDTTNNDGLGPTLLVFGIIPPFPDACTLAKEIL
jgi:hypothetical protein